VRSVNGVAEGVRTTTAACALAERHRVEMPIAQAMRRILDGELDPKQAAELLLSRQLRPENE
jgi:glycerol-3-phosphate dehydrogenase (NAD(P)+)